MSELSEADIGRLAIDMQRKRMVVEKWLNDQAQVLTLTTADQAPGWRDYEEAIDKFGLALIEFCEAQAAQ